MESVFVKSLVVVGFFRHLHSDSVEGGVRLKRYPSVWTVARVLTHRCVCAYAATTWLSVRSVKGGGEEGEEKVGERWGRMGGVQVALSGLSPAVVDCSGLPAWRLAQLGLADSMPPQ